MRRLSTHELQTIAVAETMARSHGHAIPGFSRHVIETAFARFQADGRDASLTPAELGLLEGAIETMRDHAGQPGPVVAE